jgi:FkbM family methyltransferase
LRAVVPLGDSAKSGLVAADSPVLFPKLRTLDDSAVEDAMIGATRLADGDLGPFEGSSEDEVVFGHYVREGTWAPGLVSLITERLLSPDGGTFIDVGANIGLITVPVIERTNALGLAFEPEPSNFRLLERNIAQRGLADRIETFNIAGYSEETSLRMALSSDNHGDHRVLPDGSLNGSRRTVEVAAAPLDALLADRPLTPPVIMKVDTQGCEVRVLTGAEDTLARTDYLIIEYWPAGVRRMGDSAQALEKLLTRFPFAAVLEPRAVPARLEPIEAALGSLAWVPKDGSDEGFFDLLCAPTNAWEGPGATGGRSQIIAGESFRAS